MPSNKLTPHDARIIKKSITLNGHRTALSLEQALWQALQLLAKHQQRSVSALIAQIDAARTDPDIHLSSAVRVYIVQQLQLLKD